MKEKIEKLFAEIGMNPVPFFMGWCSGTIGVIAGILVAHFN
jgi:hypothetical protein